MKGWKHWKNHALLKTVSLIVHMSCDLHNCFNFLHDRRHQQTNDSLLVRSIGREVLDNRRFLHHSRNEKTTDLPSNASSTALLAQ